MLMHTPWNAFDVWLLYGIYCTYLYVRMHVRMHVCMHICMHVRNL